MFSFNGTEALRRSSMMRARSAVAARAVILGLFVLAAGACGDLPSAPDVPLTPVETEETKVAVTEAQERLMIGISDESIRRVVGADLDALAASVASGNLPQVRMLARRAANTLVEYHSNSDGGDGPDISAMLLMLNSVANTAGSTSADISL